jgi:hypothetical protein
VRLCQIVPTRTVLADYEDVYAIPPILHEDRSEVTGVSCPDCPGVLQVRSEGRVSTLAFECRIGHTYDETELLAAKEECLEKHLWAATTALEELAELLTDLAEHHERHDERTAIVRACLERASRERADAVALRVLIEGNRPIDLAGADPARRGAGDPRAEGVEPAGGPGGGA